MAATAAKPSISLVLTRRSEDFMGQAPGWTVLVIGDAAGGRSREKPTRTRRDFPTRVGTSRAVRAARSAEEGAGRLAELALEHRRERARAVVAERQRDVDHLVADGQPLQPVQQPRLLAPLAEGHAGLAGEQALDR